MTTLPRIDEALLRPGLTPLDRAALLVRRRRVFEARRPTDAQDPAAGSDRKGED